MTMDQSEQLLFAEAALGQETEEFLASDLGRYLIGRAEQEESAAIEKLAGVSAWRKNRISQLQAEIWRARSFKSWLAEMVVSGRQAMGSIEEARREARDM